jgi:two-component system sensor histidine kinase ChvG
MMRVRAALAGITVRLMAFNILIVFLPIAGFLSLGTYERQLLASLEGSLVQQGRVLAASLESAGAHLGVEARRVIARLRQRQYARLRVIDARGALLADSSRLSLPRPEEPLPVRGQTAEPDRVAQSTFLYRLASFPVRTWRRLMRPPQQPATDADVYDRSPNVLSGPEIADALAGRYGAATRISRGQQSVTLYSAIPVMDGERVIGAVIVSQSTWRILSDLYSLRLDIFRLFLWSVATSLVLSFLLSATVTVPLRRLRDQAHGVIDARGRLAGTLAPVRRRDEIGDLSRSLGILTEKLARHIHLVETFASDVSHELKNPLASIRSALELAQGEDNAQERGQLLAMAMGDVSRMERLLAGVREISRIDSGVDGAGAGDDGETRDVRLIAERVVSGPRPRSCRGVSCRVHGEAGIGVAASAHRVIQIVENLVDNAESFSPAGGTLAIDVEREGAYALIRVSDEGPGILPEHAGRIFDRFFSFRPGEEKGPHAGLGLAIVKSIAESHGGSVRAFNRDHGGACFEVRLPAYCSR